MSWRDALCLWHPKGDWYGGWRLPEFRYEQANAAPGEEHPLRVAGRYLECAIHGDPAVRDLVLAGNRPLWCNQLAKNWHKYLTGQLEFGLLSKLDDAMPLHSQIKQVVLATMYQRVVETTPMDRATFNSVINIYPEITANPDALADCFSKGVGVGDWALMKACGAEGLAKAGYVRGGGLTAAIRSELGWIRGEQNLADPKQCVAALNRVSEHFNVWGVLVGLAPADREVLLQESLAIEGRVEPDSFAAIKEKVLLGAKFGHIGSREGAKVARWGGQGLFLREQIEQAVELKERFPNRRDGWIAWQVMTPNTQLGRAPLPVLQPDRSVIGLPEGLIVDRDWWKTASRELDSEGDELSLLVS